MGVTTRRRKRRKRGTAAVAAAARFTVVVFGNVAVICVVVVVIAVRKPPPPSTQATPTARSFGLVFLFVAAGEEKSGCPSNGSEAKVHEASLSTHRSGLLLQTAIDLWRPCLRAGIDSAAGLNGVASLIEESLSRHQLANSSWDRQASRAWLVAPQLNDGLFGFGEVHMKVFDYEEPVGSKTLAQRQLLRGNVAYLITHDRREGNGQDGV